jgi:hypothetical protein
MLIAGHERELITYMINYERTYPDTATPDAIEEYVRCIRTPGRPSSVLTTAARRAAVRGGAPNALRGVGGR